MELTIKATTTSPSCRTSAAKRKENVSGDADLFRESCKSSLAENQPITPDQLRQYVENEARLRSTDRLTQAVARSFLATEPCDTLRDTLLTWIAAMAIHGIRPVTRRRYAGRLHAIYRAAVGAAQSDPFDSLRDALAREDVPDTSAAEHNLRHISSLLPPVDDPLRHETLAMFMYMVYEPDADIADIAALTFADARPHTHQARSLVDAMGKGPRTKYVFSLGQGKLRQPQIRRNMLADIADETPLFGMHYDRPLSRATFTAIWIAAALTVNVQYGEIRAIVGELPEEYAMLGIVPPVAMSDERRREILAAVADRINDNAGQWFVMRLRRSVTPQLVKERIGETLPKIADKIEYFYPERTETRREDKKLIHYKVACLPGMLFFKTTRTRVTHIFRFIGDLAWCYRVSGREYSPYSVIPTAQMEAFQKSVGLFTSDISMELVANPVLTPGRLVRITTGIFAGLTARIVTEGNKKDSPATFLLTLTSSASIRITASLPAYALQPVE